jgi:hypothetical protein
MFDDQINEIRMQKLIIVVKKTASLAVKTQVRHGDRESTNMDL